MKPPYPKRPPRLGRVFYQFPIYYITFCTTQKQPVLDNSKVHDLFRAYAEKGARDFDVAVGRYVIMPDHIHLFVRGHPEFRLAYWVRGLKRAISDGMNSDRKPGLWQSSFFDHLLRHSESYHAKWNYVVQNPVRAGLVKSADDWQFQGEIVRLEF